MTVGWIIVFIGIAFLMDLMVKIESFLATLTIMILKITIRRTTMLKIEKTDIYGGEDDNG